MMLRERPVGCGCLWQTTRSEWNSSTSYSRLPSRPLRHLRSRLRSWWNSGRGSRRSSCGSSSVRRHTCAALCGQRFNWGCSRHLHGELIDTPRSWRSLCEHGEIAVLWLRGAPPLRCRAPAVLPYPVWRPRQPHKGSPGPLGASGGYVTHSVIWFAPVREQTM